MKVKAIALAKGGKVMSLARAWPEQVWVPARVHFKGLKVVRIRRGFRRRPGKTCGAAHQISLIGYNQEDNVPEALETNVKQGAALGVTGPCAPAGAAQAHSGLSSESSTPQASSTPRRVPRYRVTARPPRHHRIQTNTVGLLPIVLGVNKSFRLSV